MTNQSGLFFSWLVCWSIRKLWKKNFHSHPKNTKIRLSGFLQVRLAHHHSQLPVLRPSRTLGRHIQHMLCGLATICAQWRPPPPPLAQYKQASASGGTDLLESQSVVFVLESTHMHKEKHAAVRKYPCQRAGMWKRCWKIYIYCNGHAHARTHTLPNLETKVQLQKKQINKENKGR